MVTGNQDFYYQTFGDGATTNTITFDSRIYDTYWPVATQNESDAKFLDIPTYHKEAGSQIGTLPVVNGNGLGWPNGTMDVIHRGSDSHDSNFHYVTTLLGWYDSRIGGTQAQSTDIVSGNKTYYAKWSWNLQIGSPGAIMQNAHG